MQLAGSIQLAVGSLQSARGKGLGARGLSGDRICWAVYSLQSAVFSWQSSVGSFQSAVGNRQGASLSAAEIPPNARHSQRESKGAVRRQNLLFTAFQYPIASKKGKVKRKFCQETAFPAYQYPIASKKGKVKRII